MPNALEAFTGALQWEGAIGECPRPQELYEELRRHLAAHFRAPTPDDAHEETDGRRREWAALLEAKGMPTECAASELTHRIIEGILQAWCPPGTTLAQVLDGDTDGRLIHGLTHLFGDYRDERTAESLRHPYNRSLIWHSLFLPLSGVRAAKLLKPELAHAREESLFAAVVDAIDPTPPMRLKHLREFFT